MWFKKLWRNPILPRIKHPPIVFPEIAPIEEGVERPFWSVMIPTRNRPEYLRQTLESILAQGLPPEEMQIMVIDNHSEADIGALVQEIGQGRIEYFRQSEYVEFNINWTTCIQKARGHWVQLFHDDNVALPGCYAAYREAIEKGANVIFAPILGIDKDNKHLGLSQMVATTNGLADTPLQIIWQPSTFAVNTLVTSRALYEQIGGYSNQLTYGADMEIAARLFRVGTVGFLPEPPIGYRVHEEQAAKSAGYWGDQAFMKSVVVAYQLIREGQDTPYHRRMLYKGLSVSVASVSQVFRRRGEFAIAFNLAIWAFRFCPSWNLLGYMLSMVHQRYVQIPLTQVRQKVHAWRYKTT